MSYLLDDLMNYEMEKTAEEEEPRRSKKKKILAGVATGAAIGGGLALLRKKSKNTESKPVDVDFGFHPEEFSFPEFHFDEFKLGAEQTSAKDSEKTASLLNRYEGHEEVGTAKKQLKLDRRQVSAHPTHRNLTNAGISRLKYRDAKTRADMASRKKKSPKELALAEKYQQQGFTPQEAELKAFRAQRAKRRLLMGAGAAAAVGAGVGAHKYHDYVTDKTIKAGQSMQNIRLGNAKYFDKGDPYFIADRKQDKPKYRHIYGAELGAESIRSDPRH